MLFLKILYVDLELVACFYRRHPVLVALLANIDLVLHGIAELVDTLGGGAPAAGVASPSLQRRIDAAPSDRKGAVERDQGDIARMLDLREKSRRIPAISAVDISQIGIDLLQARKRRQTVTIRRR